MGKKDKQTTLFNLQGRFLGFQVEDGYKLKYLKLQRQTASTESSFRKNPVRPSVVSSLLEIGFKSGVRKRSSTNLMSRS